MPSRRNDHSYVKRRDALKRKARAGNWPCHLCRGDKGPILYDEDYRHPLSFTADHIDAVAAGGRMLGQLAPAHRSCNSKRQAKPLDEYLEQQETRRPAPTKRTVKW
jgi:hypothetical protein